MKIAQVRFVVPEGRQEKMECWRELFDRFEAGEELNPHEFSWFRSFGKSYDCKAYRKIHGLPWVEFKD